MDSCTVFTVYLQSMFPGQLVKRTLKPQISEQSSAWVLHQTSLNGLYGTAEPLTDANTVWAVTDRLNRPEPDRPTPDRIGAPRPGEGEEEERKRSTLTFPQPVLEVGVTPSLLVEVDAVTDEQSAAHPRGQRAGPAAHHVSRDPVGSRRVSG